MRSNLRRLVSILALLAFISACKVKPTSVPSPKATITVPGDQRSATSDLRTGTSVPQSTIRNPKPTLIATSDQRSTNTIPITPTPLSPRSTPTSSIPNQPSTLINTQYFISVQYDFNSRSLSVDEIITYTNNTSQSLDDLLLVVPANRWPGAFKLDAIRWADGQLTQDFALNLHRLSLLLPQPLPSGRQIGLSLSYELTLPPIPDPSEAAPQPFGYTSSQSNLVDWYAYVPPYRDGWLVHDPGFWGEFQVFDAGDFNVDLTVANAPAGLVIAASALPFDTSQGDQTTYHYKLDSARTFALSISPYYHVFSQTVELDGSSVEVYSYAYAFNLQAGKAALADTARAVQLYSELFGTYPHASLSVVEADFLDGMEYDGLYFLSKGFYNLYDGTPNGYLTAIAVHETAHQWWYGLVGNDQALEPWLDEGLCTFTERVFYEHFYPDALTRWWQPYRVDYYEPQGLVGGAIYDYAGYRPYRDAVYLHGQEFLQAVRQRIGDQAFFAFLKDYVALYRGQIATRKDFFALLASHSKVGIDDLVEEYFGK